jgi:uncharacterized protein (TIGR02599 family)
MTLRPRSITAGKAFSLVELLVSMAVLAIILLVTMSIVNSTQKISRQTTGQLSSFREAQAAFDSMTQKIGQATLNANFDYDPPIYSGDPEDYVRESDLHFVCGAALDLVPASLDRRGHAIFFQAPLGFTDKPLGSGVQLTNLLNAVGFFIAYGDDSAWRPDFLDSISNLSKRYRLMQMVQSSEKLAVYAQKMTAANRFDWFQEPLTATPALARPIAENVIAAVIFPKESTTGSPTPLTTDYSYDTKAYLSSATAELSRNQLPPFLEVTLVALDEASAIRFEQKFGGTAPLLQPGALFTNPANYDADMGRLTDFLNAERLSYRVFKTNILIRQAKFSR